MAEFAGGHSCDEATFLTEDNVKTKTSLTFGSMALMSGLFGALASCLGKIALDPNSALTRLEFLATHGAAEYAARCLFFISMIICNALMLGAFVDGMEQAGSVAGTALSNSANFLSSAVIGYFVWNERFTTSWCIGFLFILIGTILLTTAQAEKRPSPHRHHKND